MQTLLAAIDDIKARCEVARESPSDDTLRTVLILSLDTDAWPFQVTKGVDGAHGPRIEDARGAAQMLRGGLAASPMAYRAMVDQLIVALNNLRRALQSASGT